MSKNTLSSAIFLIAAALCSLSAIRMFTSGVADGIWLLIAGAVFLCFGSVLLKKAKDEEKKPNKEKIEKKKDAAEDEK